MSVCLFVTGSLARLSNSDNPRNVTSALKTKGMLLLDFRLDFAAHSLYSDAPCRETSAPLPLPTPPHPILRTPSRSPRQQIPTSWGLDASVFSLSSLDENANLGTVMRYEEIGEWGWESGCLEPPASTTGRVAGGEARNPASPLRRMTAPRLSHSFTGRLFIPPDWTHAGPREVGPDLSAIFPSEPPLLYPKDMEVEPQCPPERLFFCPCYRTRGRTPPLQPIPGLPHQRICLFGGRGAESG